jgi:hypothetical protein
MTMHAILVRTIQAKLRCKMVEMMIVMVATMVHHQGLGFLDL